MSRLAILNVAYPFAPVTAQTAGGAEQVLAMIDKALIAAGHRSVVVAMAGSRVSGELIPFWFSGTSLDAHTRAKLHAEYRELLLKILRLHTFDVVHFHGLDFSRYFPHTLAPCATTVHLPYNWYPREAFDLPVNLVWVSRNQQNTSGIDRGSLIPNGIPLDRFYGGVERQDYVLCMGRICREKAFHLALDAAEVSGRRVILAGQVFPYPEHQQYFEKEIGPRLGMRHRFVGPVSGSQKRDLLARAYCVVIPSQVAETSSLVAMEALACGTPVIAMRIGALPEIVDHGRTGWLVDSVEELSEAIDDAAQIRSRHCRAAAEQRFSAQRMTDAYLQLYGAINDQKSVQVGFPKRRISGGGADVKSQIEVQAITSLRALHDLEPEWRKLWERCPETTVFQHPHWLISWVEAFGTSRLWVLAIRKRDLLVGLAPLFLYGTGVDRIVAPLGAGVSDYLDVLIDACVPEALTALVFFLQQNARIWTRFEFQDIPETSLLIRSDFSRTFVAEGTGMVRVESCDSCPQLDLPFNAEGLKAVVPAKQLRNLRVARRQLERGQVEMARRENLDQFLDAMFRLHEKRWQNCGQPGVLSDPRVQELHRRAVPRLFGSGLLRLFGLRLDGQLIAALMAFSDRGVMRLYMQGYDPGLAHYSPGTQLVGAALEQSIRENKRVADFMRGRETYKYYWGARDVPTFRITVDATAALAKSIFTDKSVA